MSTSPILLPTPPSETRGYIAGRFIEASLDTSDDPDNLPDFRPSVGSVMLTPLSVMSTDGRTIIGRKSATFTIDPESGELLNPKTGFSGAQALWTGWWKATFVIAGTPIPPLTFELKTEHTAALPFELIVAQPYVPPPNVTVQTVALPTLQEGYYLKTVGGALTWAPISETVAWGDIVGKPSTFPPAEHTHATSYKGGALPLGQPVWANPGTTSTNTRNPDILTMVPFWLPDPVTIDQIGIRSPTTMQYQLSRWHRDQVTGDFVRDVVYGTINAASTAADALLMLNVNDVLPAGIFYIGHLHLAGAATVRTVTTWGFWNSGTVASLIDNNAAAWAATTATATIPAATAPAATYTGHPRIYWRRGA